LHKNGTFVKNINNRKKFVKFLNEFFHFNFKARPLIRLASVSYIFVGNGRLEKWHLPES
jgi:hypothetical protein